LAHAQPKHSVVLELCVASLLVLHASAQVSKVNTSQGLLIPSSKSFGWELLSYYSLLLGHFKIMFLIQ